MMNAANLPTQADLNSLYGAWNPGAYMRGFENQGLADQFREQSFLGNNQTLESDQQKIDQAKLMNPLLIESQRLGNEGTTLTNQGKIMTNQSSGLDLASKQDTHGERQQLLHKQLAREMSDEDLTAEGNRILKMYQKAKLDGNEADTIKYGNVLDTLVGAVASKASDRVQKRNLTEGGWINDQILADKRNAALLGAAEIRKPVGKTGKTWQEQFNNASPDKRLGIAYMAVETGRNPYTGDDLSDEEKAAFEKAYAAAVSTVNAGNQARAAGAQGVAPTVNAQTRAIEIKDRPPVSAAPGTAANPIKLD